MHEGKLWCASVGMVSLKSSAASLLFTLWGKPQINDSLNKENDGIMVRKYYIFLFD